MSDVPIPTVEGCWKTEVYGFFAPSPAVRGFDLAASVLTCSHRHAVRQCSGLCCRFRAFRRCAA